MIVESRAAAATLLRAPTVRHRPATLTDTEWSAAERMLSGGERRRLDLLDARGAQSFLGGRLLLRGLAGELLGVDAAEVPLVAGCIDCGIPHGRPIVDGTSLQVSLAHTVDLVVAAATWDTQIGVDAEPIAGSAERLDAIEAITGTRSLRHWTRVEAVLKADGRGLRVDPRRVRVTELEPHVEADVRGSVMRYRILDLDIGRDATGPGSIGSIALAI